ncbi:MAG: hypothetical protein M1829_002977 [Trizodia sp. TS-e1964]|nr:MAG: hypothetical protein M1829_002977 [Trizodia sp. TS-e1964]
MASAPSILPFPAFAKLVPLEFQRSSLRVITKPPRPQRNGAPDQLGALVEFNSGSEERNASEHSTAHEAHMPQELPSNEVEEGVSLSEQTAWENHTSPLELGLVQPGTSRELCRIIFLSIENQRKTIARKKARALQPGGSPSFLKLPLNDESQVKEGGDDISNSLTSHQDRSPTSETSATSCSEKLGSFRSSVASSQSSALSVSPRSPKSSIPAPLAISLALSPKNQQVLSPQKPVSPRAEALRRFLRDRHRVSKCNSCLEEVKSRKLVSLQCQHKYCKECFGTLVNTALLDEDYFPPKCCSSAIPVKTILWNSDSTLRSSFKIKANEFSVPVMDRLYCAAPSCGKWIPLTKKVKDIVPCPHCQSNICSRCRNLEHTNGDCPEDHELQAALKESDRYGWQRCYRCRSMVELSFGCRHITCRCNAQFCYVCASPWRTCACTEEDRSNKQVQLAQQREADALEAQDVLRAIAEVERSEREEAVRKTRGEPSREEIEAKRRQIGAKIERTRQEQVLRKIKNYYETFRDDVLRIHNQQLELLIQRHQNEDSSLSKHRASSEASFIARCVQEKECLMNDNHLLVQKTLTHNLELAEMDRRHQEEEDDYFIGIRAHLRGKPNREERERMAVAKVKKAQQEERRSLLEHQRQEFEQLKQIESTQLIQLEIRLSNERQMEKIHEKLRSEEHARQVVCDNKWFEVIATARLEMLEELEREMVIASYQDAPLDLSSRQSPALREWNLEQLVTAHDILEGEPAVEMP